jgi:hypothetical protein
LGLSHKEEEKTMTKGRLKIWDYIKSQVAKDKRTKIGPILHK